MKTFLTTLKYSLRIFTKNKFQLYLIFLCLAVSLSFSYILIKKAYSDSYYNKHFSNYKSIFRLTSYYESYEVHSSNNKIKVLSRILEQTPEIAKSTSITQIHPKLIDHVTGIQSVCDNFFLMDNSALDIFDIKQADNKTRYLKNGEILISIKESKKIFNTTDVVGKMISINFNKNNYDFIIAGVFNNFAKPATFTPDFIVNFEGVYTPEQKEKTNAEFFLVIDNDDVEIVKRKVNQLESSKDGVTFHLQALDDIYFHSSLLINDFHKKGNLQFYSLSLLIASVLLVFGFINFLSLIISFYIQRVKEFYIRKINGSTSKNFTSLFLIELSLIFVFAIVVSYSFLLLFKPYNSFNLCSDVFLNSYQKSYLLLILAATIVLLILITVLVLKKLILNRNFSGYWNYISYKGNKTFNKVFQILQLSVVLLLIIFITTVSKQINHSFSGIKGYNHSNLIQAGFPVFSGENKYDLLKDKLLSYPGIESVSGSYGVPMKNAHFFMNLTSKIDNEKITFEATAVCPEYFDVLGAVFINKINQEKLKNFSDTEIIINETGYRVLGLNNTTDAVIDGFKIKGVVRDINDETLSNKVPPKVYMIAKEPISALLVKHDGKKKAKAYQQIIQNEYNNIFPDYNVDIKTYYNIFSDAYASELELRNILMMFLTIMFLLTTFGFFSIANYEFIRNAKSLAINKVLGAKNMNLMGKQVNRWIFIFVLSSLISCILGYYLSNRWLKNYFYKIDLNLEYFVYSIAIGCVIIGLNILIFYRKVLNLNVCRAMKEDR